MTECSHSYTMDKRLSGILLTVVCHKALSLALSNLLHTQKIKFASYTEDITDLIERHGVRSHLYVDDTQLYDCYKLDGVPRYKVGYLVVFLKLHSGVHSDAYN